MKLDKIRFAKVVSWISRMTNGLEFATEDLLELDNIIDIPVVYPKVAEEDVNELLRQINNPDGFISAIKAYRVLTGAI